MSNELMRFSVAMPEDLLIRFDSLVARRGLAKNRSEVVRDLVRDALVEEDCAIPGTEVLGTLTITFNHHSSDLQEKLHAIQHDYFEYIISSMHVHLDAHNCLEVIVLRGETGLVQDIANLILGTKGVKNGKLVVTTTGGHI
ncbi:MAG: nickel-responsive transcriptional regulator NikR [Eggerthellaceae bacterium]|nr:nickel-responsive transcriptional regulator NikR [Eggerthellaceae bacterium]MBQ6455299.1 nickel-responsive transcriptional regulator NikR [Eggerthellaceae bacterium]